MFLGFSWVLMHLLESIHKIDRAWHNTWGRVRRAPASEGVRDHVLYTGLGDAGRRSCDANSMNVNRWALVARIPTSEPLSAVRTFHRLGAVHRG